MTPEKQIEIISQLDDKTISILKSKREDYASKDVLSNFKLVSSVVSQIGIDTNTPEGYAMLMVILKIVRIWNLKAQNKTPKHESLQDSYEDGINYFKLALCCELDKEIEEVKDSGLTQTEIDFISNTPYAKAFELRDKDGYVTINEKHKIHINFWINENKK